MIYSQQHYGWVSVSDKDGGWDVWLIFAKMGNEPEMDRKFSGNGQMKGKMRLQCGSGPEMIAKMNRKWTGHESGHEPEMKAEMEAEMAPEMDRKWNRKWHRK